MAEPNFQFDLDEALNQPPRGMLRDPFGSKEAPYFTTEARNQQLAMLEHLSRYSAMLLIIEGPSGSGKTAFMQEFARHQVDSSVISQVHGSMLMTAGQLLDAIYAGFHDVLGSIKPDSTFSPLLTFANEKEQKGQTALVLIDCAQELNTDAIIMLLDMMSLANENQAVPHVVLFSEQPLARNLDAFQRNRFLQLSHEQYLQPFSLEQTRGYLLHRVRGIGGEINLPFTDKQIRHIHKVSNGYPGAINRTAQGLMGVGQADEPSPSAFKFNLALGFPLVHMALLSVVMLAILITVIFSDTGDTSPVAGEAIALVKKAPVAQSQTIARIEEMQKRLNANNQPFSLPPIPADALMQTDNNSTKTTAITAAPIKQATLVDTLATTLIPVAKTIEVTPAVTKQKPALTQASQAPPAATDRFEKTTWWLAQSPTRYTLQLLGTYNLGTVKDFIRDQGSLDHFSYFHALHKEKDWYVVVYGNYRNRSEAIAAVETLPQELRGLNPWARSVRGVQQDIRKAQ